MKPVYQTRFGDKGNCRQAAIASLLELPLDSVPDFVNDGGSWWDIWMHGWFNLLGLREVCIGTDGGLDPYWQDVVLDGVEYMGIGKSKNDVLHSVVCRGAQIVHDPLPDSRLKWSDLSMIQLLVVITPARPTPASSCHA